MLRAQPARAGVGALRSTEPEQQDDAVQYGDPCPVDTIVPWYPGVLHLFSPWLKSTDYYAITIPFCQGFCKEI